MAEKMEFPVVPVLPDSDTYRISIASAAGWDPEALATWREIAGVIEADGIDPLPSGRFAKAAFVFSDKQAAELFCTVVTQKVVGAAIESTTNDLQRDSCEMRRGYIAMFDALGWKGIWKRHPTEAVLESVRTVRSTLESVFAAADHLLRPAPEEDVRQVLVKARAVVARLHEQCNEMGAEFDPAEGAAEFEARAGEAAALASRQPLLRATTLFLSDTLVAATDIPRVWGDEAAAHMAPVQRLFIAQAVAKMLQVCALGSVPLIFRGVIADGHFLLDGNQMLGEAVDAAAQRMNIADMAVVWFASSAADPNLPDIPYSTKYDMPLRDGRTIRVQAVNPFFGCQADQLEAVHTGMLQAFGNDDEVDLAIKRQNTAAFLDKARRQWAALLAQHARDGVAL